MRFKKIYVEITNRCNLNCSFCSKSNRIKRDMSILEFEKVISKIKDYTSYIYLHIKGEPLLHPDLEEILNICSKNDISVNITTNGINIKSSKDILLNQCVRQVNFSLHSYAFDNPDDYINSINDYVLSASSLGNIYTDDLESILKSERFKNMLEGFKNNKKCENLCKHCNFLDRFIDK